MQKERKLHYALIKKLFCGQKLFVNKKGNITHKKKESQCNTI